MKRRVLLLSGGLDSMGAMMKTIMDPALVGETVRVFHMEYTNSPNAKTQKHALKLARVHFPEYDIYVHKTESLDMKEPLDVCLKAMLTFGTNNFLEGFYEDVTELELIVGYEYEEHDSTTVDELNEAVQLIRKAYLTTGIGILPTKVVSPVRNLNKRQIKNLIGDLKFWSCRMPLIKENMTYTPCGVCNSCSDLRKYGIEHPSFTPEHSLITEKAFSL